MRDSARATNLPMASSESTYDERLRLADSFEECKEQLTPPHYKLLVHEALAETRVGTGKLKYILALARRCKSGAFSAKLLAEKVDKEYPNQQQEHKGGEQQHEEGQRDGEAEGSVAGYEDIDTEVDEPKNQSGDEEEENEEVADEAEVEKLLENTKTGFFRKNSWSRSCTPFVLPGAGYWVDANNIKMFRKSIHSDFAKATPKPMPVYIERNPYCNSQTKALFNAQEKGYHLCKRVAVTSDGKIYRATDREICKALADTGGAPTTDAPTYVKAVEELRRRHALESGSGPYASGRKRRRVRAAR